MSEVPENAVPLTDDQIRALQDEHAALDAAAGISGSEAPAPGPLVTGFDMLAADSTDPARIPASFTRAIAYADGKYAWPREQVRRFPYIAHYTVTGDPAAARYARVQDNETGDSDPAQFPPFAETRARLYPGSHGVCYASLSRIPAVLTAIKAAGLWTAPWGLLPAWWWGKPRFPTVHEVLAELQQAYGVTDLPAGRLDGCQWQNNPGFDVLVTYNPDLLHRRPEII